MIRYLHPLLWLAAMATHAQAGERWAGHQVTVTTRHVPLLGDIVTRQDVYMIATAERTADGFIVDEQPCAIAIRSGAKVRLDFESAAVRRIPPVHAVWRTAPDGYRGTWAGGWDTRDVDGDGKPGLKVAVTAPLCNGTMSIATNTRFDGAAILGAQGALEGNVSISVSRSILDVDTTCLGLVPKRQEEVVSGKFVYVPVEAHATCTSWARTSDWPAQVP
jgi:hypothetical protein